MSEKIKEVSEKTMVPISLVIILISWMAWFFVIYNKDMTKLSNDIALIKGKLGMYYAEGEK